MILNPKISTLSNGLQVAFLNINYSPVSHCALMINAGSRDDLKNCHGIAHLTEHMLFKGTTKRKAYQILNRLDAVGGDLNAYTSKEETCIHASFLNEHAERAIELIADVAFNSTYPEKEIKKEKAVVSDEIRSYFDNPAENIFDDFEELLFRNHALGHNILGTQESLAHINRTDIIKYTNSAFQPQNMVFTYVGNLKESKLFAYIDKYFAFQKNSSSQLEKRSPFKNYKPFHIKKEIDSHSVHMVIGNKAYSIKHKNRIGLVLLTNLLGGPAMNAKLSIALREKHGISYQVDANYTAFSDSGIFTIYSATDQKQSEKCKEIIFKELHKLRNSKISLTLLNQAKTQLKGQLSLAHENRSGMSIGFAKSLLMLNKIESIEKIFSQIDKVTNIQILEIANEVFDKDKLSILEYH
jgi:predicted Zn-dependent peptidase